MLRIPYSQLLEVVHRATLGLGLTGDRAELCARLFAEATRDGVHSHGINRFPRFAQQVSLGVVDVDACIVRREAMGAIERWDGRGGPGNVNAHDAMARAMELARKHGMGGVALSNTNHWMRGGSYGWQAAEEGFVALCWSNSMANLPPWGGIDSRLGNNPFVIAVPRQAGHVVLDMAISQYSYGSVDNHVRAGRPLSVPGGYDEEGHLTTDPEALSRSGRMLPIGYWKGSALALSLDLVAALLAGGRTTRQIEADPVRETGLSQLFIAVDVRQFGGNEAANALIDGAIEFMKDATPVSDDVSIRYPGEQTLANRRENERLGVPVDAGVWGELRLLANL